MNVQRLLLIAILLCLCLSLAVTLASYSYYTAPLIMDASFLYRGWPLYWIVESWSLWGEPPYYHTFDFQPLNFLIDIVFWAVFFQLPSVILLLLWKVKGRENESEGLRDIW